jgi:hypothetical protein
MRREREREELPKLVAWEWRRDEALRETNDGRSFPSLPTLLRKAISLPFVASCSLSVQNVKPPRERKRKRNPGRSIAEIGGRSGGLWR